MAIKLPIRRVGVVLGVGGLVAVLWQWSTLPGLLQHTWPSAPLACVQSPFVTLGSLEHAPFRIHCTNSSKSGRDRMCFVVGLCYNNRRGLFVVTPDPPAPNYDAKAIVANLRAADPPDDFRWSPKLVPQSKLTRQEYLSPVVLLPTRTLLVVSPLWDYHLTHYLVNLLLPLHDLVHNLDDLPSRVPAIADLWTSGTDEWMAGATWQGPSSSASNVSGVLAGGGHTGPSQPTGTAAARRYGERTYPDVFLVDSHGQFPVEVLKVGRVYRRRIDDLPENTTLCYGRAVMGLNNSCSLTYCEYLLPPATYATLRESVRSYYRIPALRPSRPSAAPRVVIVQRQRTRRLLNLDPVSALVADRLHTTVSKIELETYSFEDQVRLFSATDVLITVHGNACGNLIWMQAGSYLVEIFAFGWVTPFFEQLANQADVRYEPIRCNVTSCGDANELRNTSLPAKQRSVTAPLDQLGLALDRLASAWTGPVPG